MQASITRRAFTRSGASLFAFGALGGRSFAKPASPVALNIVDVACNLALTQKAIEAYRAAKPDFVSKITFTQSPAPELPAKIKAQHPGGTDVGDLGRHLARFDAHRHHGERAARLRHGVPELCVVLALERARQYRLRPQDAKRT